MKSIMKLFIFNLIFFGAVLNIRAQSEPVLYFCTNYGPEGEEGISDNFTAGYITIVVKADDPLYLSNVEIQFDKYDCASNSYSFYKKFNYTVDPGSNYFFFTRNNNSDLEFEEPGIYRVYLLDENNETVTSALVEISAGE